jgi:tRNA (guanine37-N1)-methyltransferase
MEIDVITIFPEYLAPARLSLLGKATESGIVHLRVHDLRQWTTDRHRTVDDTPYGGGVGMVMKPEPWGRAIDALLDTRAAGPPTGAVGVPPDHAMSDAASPSIATRARGVSKDSLPGAPAVPSCRVRAGGSEAAAAQAQPEPVVQPVPSEASSAVRLVIPTASGNIFDQTAAARLAQAHRLIFACGRYEGIDARVALHYHERPEVQVEELSIGDYVLAGGEVAALVMIEAITRLIPGVLGNAESLVEESHADPGLLEYPVYTKPPTWRGLDVPAVALSGHHGKIAAWRREQAMRRTRQMRPDLFAKLDD